MRSSDNHRRKCAGAPTGRSRSTSQTCIPSPSRPPVTMRLPFPPNPAARSLPAAMSLLMGPDPSTRDRKIVVLSTIRSSSPSPCNVSIGGSSVCNVTGGPAAEPVAVESGVTCPLWPHCMVLRATSNASDEHSPPTGHAAVHSTVPDARSIRAMPLGPDVTSTSPAEVIVKVVRVSGDRMVDEGLRGSRRRTR